MSLLDRRIRLYQRLCIVYLVPVLSSELVVGRFLADRTIGRAYGTVSRLSVCRLFVVCRL